MKIKLDPGAFMPEYAHEQDAGTDLRSPVNAVVLPHDSAIIHTGIHVEIPHGYVGFLKSKSGLNVNHNITYDTWTCSECGYTVDTDDPDDLTKFCPNCGAKMEGGHNP